MMKFYFLLGMVLWSALNSNVNAQLLQWNTFGNLGTETTEPSVFNNANIAAANLTQGSITPAANGNRFGGNAWWTNVGYSTPSTIAEAVAGNDYIQFIVTPNVGFSFTPTSFVFNWDKSASGPQNVALRSSFDAFATDLGIVAPTAAIGTQNTITITGLTNITVATTFRIYGYGATAAAGTGGFDIASNIVNVQLNGSTASTSSPTQLAITNINPASPTVNTPFSVTVQSQDAGNVASNVTVNTDVALTLTTGTGILGGTLTGTILAGTNTVVITGVTYNTVENGVVITATRTAGDVLTPGNSSPFNVLPAASQLVLVNVPATGFTNTNLTTFTVEARRPDNSIDVAYTGNITIAKVTGPGNVTGTFTVAAVAGIATFNAVQLNAIGIYTINASDGSLTSATSGNIVIVDPPSLTEFLLPQYIQGINGTNNNRLPYVYRATLNFLLPNSTYRYTNLAGNAADILTLTGGAGNQIFYNAAGTFTRNTAGTSLSLAGSYGEFTTDALGSYTGWFITEPTSNAARFTPGTQLYMRILLNDGLGGTSVVLTLNTTNTAIVYNLGTGATEGTGIYGMTHTADRDLVFLYDNVNGTGRPLTSSFIENDGTSGATTYATFYQTNVDALAKTWGTFIPNTLANGVRRIQYMNGGGNNVYAFTSSDGVWPGPVTTVNPTGGTAALVIDRTATGTSGDFIVDSTVSLASTVTVNNSLTLNNGIVTTTAANLLTLTNAASTTGASNTSFVSGPIKKIGMTGFIFPVGKTGTGYVPIEISAFVAGTSADEFTAEYIRSSARALGPVNAGPGLSHVSLCDYWTLVKGIATPTSLDVTAYWNANNPCGQPGSYITNINTLTIAHFDDVPDEWTTYALSPIVTGGSTNAAGSITWPGAIAFGPLSFGSTTFGDNPLPITINYFNGAKQNGNHLLNWKVTCVSTPSANLEIERSTDGITYSSIYSIYATALRCQQPFDFTDNAPAKGTNYYRLKMTDVDGKISYSSIVHLINAVKGMDILNIAPNPILNGNFNVKISAAEKMQMELLITDMQGRVLQKINASLIAGFNAIPVNVRNLAAGTYQLYGNTADGRTRVLRFVVQ